MSPNTTSVFVGFWPFYRLLSRWLLLSRSLRVGSTVPLTILLILADIPSLFVLPVAPVPLSQRLSTSLKGRSNAGFQAEPAVRAEVISGPDFASALWAVGPDVILAARAEVKLRVHQASATRALKGKRLADHKIK